MGAGEDHAFRHVNAGVLQAGGELVVGQAVEAELVQRLAMWTSEYGLPQAFATISRNQLWLVSALRAPSPTVRSACALSWRLRSSAATSRRLTFLVLVRGSSPSRIPECARVSRTAATSTLREVGSDSLFDLGERERQLVEKVWHDSEATVGHAVGQPHHQSSWMSATPVRILDLVGIDVLAVRIDDDVLRRPTM